MCPMYARSITYTSEMQGDGALLSKWHNISSMERPAPKFIHVSASAPKSCQAMRNCDSRYYSDRTETSDGLMPSSYSTCLPSTWYGYTTSQATSDKRENEKCGFIRHSVANSVNSYLQRCLESIANEIIVALCIWLHGGCQKFVSPIKKN